MASSPYQNSYNRRPAAGVESSPVLWAVFLAWLSGAQVVHFPAGRAA